MGVESWPVSTGGGLALNPVSGEIWRQRFVQREDAHTVWCHHLIHSEHSLALRRISPHLGPRLLTEARWGRHSPHEVDRRPPSTAFFTPDSLFTLGTVHRPGGRCLSLALLAVFPLEEIKLIAEREENPRLSLALDGEEDIQN